jgi:hypothetical protein
VRLVRYTLTSVVLDVALAMIFQLLLDEPTATAMH